MPAATVILLREGAGGPEVFLVRRHRRSTFMSDAFVFPGGRREPADRSDEEAAIRELFEEAGVLLTTEPIAQQDEWRRRLNADERSFADLLRDERREPDLARLHYWARWITPSVEPKRFDAAFYLAELPPGQTPSFDQKETVEELWITPAEALARQAAGTLKLPPPQLRTFVELAEHGSFAALRRASEARRAHAHPVMPRFAQLGETVALLLPWDPEYQERGVGEGTPMPPGHFLATGDSRFLLEGMTWRLASAPTG
jgi:8-oxo-dGTP pyrophosphatase MutT (NUDIX family)